MSCTDPKIGELITLYEFGELSNDDKRKFEAHLLSCDYCFQSLYELGPAIARMQEKPELFLPALVREPFWVKIKRKLAALIPERGPAWIAIPATAVAVLLFLLLRPSPELSDLARLEPVPYRSLQVKSGAEATDAERLFEEGMAAYLQKDYAGATAKLSEAVRQDSTNAGFHFYLGLSYLLTKNIDPAIAHLQKTIALGGNSVLEKAYWYLGNAWLLKEDRAQALAALRKVVEMEGDYQWEAEEITGKIEKLSR
jgi:tetratricopeptide (TPR) repeat protein